MVFHYLHGEETSFPEYVAGKQLPDQPLPARSSTDICLAFTLDLDKANSVPTFLMMLKSPCGAPFCHKAAAPRSFYCTTVVLNGHLTALFWCIRPT